MPETTDSLSSQHIPAPRLPLESPREILDAVARELTGQTGGVLVGDIRISRNDAATMIRLGMRVPAMGGGREGILTAVHPNDRDYPVWIHAAYFPRSLSVPPYAILTPEQEKEDFVATNAEEFRQLVARVMNSEDVVADREWFIARTKEIQSQQIGEAENR